jgi:hypothetical protein
MMEYRKKITTATIRKAIGHLEDRSRFLEDLIERTGVADPRMGWRQSERSGLLMAFRVLRIVCDTGMADGLALAEAAQEADRQSREAPDLLSALACDPSMTGMNHPPGPKTLEEARALPEVSSKTTVFTPVPVTDGRGVKLVATPRALSPVPLAGDDIAFFLDAGGREMEVIHTVEHGWVKTRMR